MTAKGGLMSAIKKKLVLRQSKSMDDTQLRATKDTNPSTASEVMNNLPQRSVSSPGARRKSLSSVSNEPKERVELMHDAKHNRKDETKEIVTKRGVIRRRYLEGTMADDIADGVTSGLGSQVQSLLAEITTLNKSLRNAETNIDKNGNVASEHKDLKQLNEELTSAKTFIQRLTMEKERHLQRKNSVELKLGEFEEYKMHLKTDIVNLYHTVDDLNEEIVDLKTKLQEAHDDNEDFIKDRADLRHQLYVMKKQNDGLAHVNDELRLEIRDLKDSSDAKSAHCIMLDMERERILDTNNDLEKRIRNLQCQIVSFVNGDEDVQHIFEANEIINDRIMDAEKARDDALQDLSEVKQQLDAQRHVRDTMEAEMKDITKANQTLKSDNVQLNQQIRKLTEKVDFLDYQNEELRSKIFTGDIKVDENKIATLKERLHEMKTCLEETNEHQTDEDVKLEKDKALQREPKWV
ncbi:unnamed protein product [Owenia fusiformis]|uniref:Uncharacterized protein n=1 Tax=Owenia fusiformis TaxID=6347 RepID=A0A8J1U4I9_OWEFU|nr:unnamed protein product [Owenia fusiformis]